VKPVEGVLPFPTSPTVREGAELVDALEALLFAASSPVRTGELCRALEAEPAAVKVALSALAQHRQGSGVQLVEIGGQWQLRTAPRFASAVARLVGGRPEKLSRAAVETLSIIAYRQPVTRSEVDALRGVSSGALIKRLVDRGLVRSAGRAEVPGRPIMYGTTQGFLELFSLRSLDELPELADLEELEDDAQG